MRHVRWLRDLLIVVVVAGLTCTAVFADDWPQFRGPKRNGVSAETGLLKQWPAGGPKFLWTASGCGVGFSSAAIAKNTVYTSGDIDGKAHVIAFDLDGKPKWRRSFGQGHPRGRFPGTRSTPTVDGDSVYCLGPQGDLSCVDAGTGRPRWSVNIIKRFRGRNITWKLAESVLIDGNNVICTPGGRDATLAALNKRTGATVWTSAGLSDPPGYASPIIFKVGPGRIISTLTAKSLVGVSADDGHFLFRYDRPIRDGANCPTPVFHRGCVFTAAGYGTGGKLIKVNAGRTSVTTRQAWETKALVNRHGGFVIVDDHIYGHSARGDWVCLDFKTGRRTYSNKGVGRGSVIAADGMLYCFSERGGTVALVKADPNSHEIVSRFRIPQGGSGATWAHPSIANGRLYLRHADKLFCYDIKAK